MIQINDIIDCPANDSDDAGVKPISCHDYRGLKCPLPVLKIRRVLQQIEINERAEFLADDPASPLDIAHFCDSEGHHLEVKQQTKSLFYFCITKNKT